MNGHKGRDSGRIQPRRRSWRVTELIEVNGGVETSYSGRILLQQSSVLFLEAFVTGAQLSFDGGSYYGKHIDPSNPYKEE